jgi:AraC-like DNA-binding protein
MDLNTNYMYNCNMNTKLPINNAPEFPEIEIHVFDYIGLGGKGQWNWVQNNSLQNNSVGPYWRIYWNDAPGGFIKVGRREFELTPDKVVVLSSGTVYSSRLENAVRHFHVHCSIGRPFSQVPPQLFELRDPELVRLAAATADYTNTNHSDYRTQMRLHVYICSVLLALPQDLIPPYTEYDQRISLAINALDKSKRKSNRELARTVNMSTNGFLQLFRQETGIPPQTYSRAKRLSDAATMLHFSENTIEEIAKATDFCDRYHFSKAFRKEYGLGPAEFRKSKLPSKYNPPDNIE